MARCGGRENQLKFARERPLTPAYYFLARLRHEARVNATIDINARNPGVFVGSGEAVGTGVAAGVGVACPNSSVTSSEASFLLPAS
jgi:hypothetical protein